jgi:hypothetical protein
MTCPALLEPLACQQTGVAYLAAPYTAGSTALVLQEGMGAAFPVPSGGRVFYVDVGGCGCCARLQVTGRVGDTLTVIPSTVCSCLSAGARVSYAASSPEHMRLIARESMPIFLPPLKYDCATNTVSVDCAQLKALITSPCVG